MNAKPLNVVSSATVARLPPFRAFERVAGDCDLCGSWDSDLLNGIGRCCRFRPGVDAGARYPVNDHVTECLLDAADVVLQLDQAGIGILRAEVGDHGASLTLMREPPRSLVPWQHVSVRRVTDGRDVEKVGRGELRGVRLEWVLP